MFSYLRGKIISITNVSNHRVVLIIDVNGIGYEVQVTPRLIKNLEKHPENIIEIFTHYQLREDQATLYGFSSLGERDLFRQLISVTGIGPQLALALLDTLGLVELVQSIVTGNTKILSKTPGVGEKTAARIALELKTKLKQWYQLNLVNTASSLEIIEDLEMTLLTLGYTSDEIEQTIAKLSQDHQLNDQHSIEDLLKQAIAHLSES